MASPGPPMDEFGGTVTYSDPNLSDERELANLINQGYRREDAIKMIFDRNFNQLNRINSNNSNHNSAYELGHSASMSFYKSQALQRTPSTQSMDAFNPNASGYSVGSVAISSNHSSMHGQSMQNIPTMPLNPSPAQLYHTPPQQPGHSVQVISPVARVPPMIPQLALHNGMTPTTPSRPSKITPRAMPTTPPPQISPRMMQQSSPAPLPAPGAVFHQVAAQYVASNATSPTPAVRTNEAEVEALRLAIQESLADASPLRPTDEEIERLAIDKANEQALQEALQASMEEMKDCPLVSCHQIQHTK